MEGQRQKLQPQRDERSIGSLFKELGDESSRLIREEVQLAKAEMAEKVDVYKNSATKMIVGGGLMIAAVIVLVTALNRGLTVLLNDIMGLEAAVWISPVIVGVVIGLIGWSMIKGGKSAIQEEGVTPHRTVDSLRTNKEWAKQEVKERRNG